LRSPLDLAGACDVVLDIHSKSNVVAAYAYFFFRRLVFFAVFFAAAFVFDLRLFAILSS
jgi:hypothetical protein